MCICTVKIDAWIISLILSYAFQADPHNTDRMLLTIQSVVFMIFRILLCDGVKYAFGVVNRDNNIAIYLR